MTEIVKSYPHSKFRNVNGQIMTRSLFYELSYMDTSHVLYTLKDIDWKGYKSLFLLYLEMEDLTEYEFANTYFENWTHWVNICNSEWFSSYITRWRTELNLKLESRALKQVIKQAKSQNPNSFSANKMLLDKLWKEPNKPTKGRPSKDDIRGELKRRADEEQRLQEDFDRILGGVDLGGT